MESSTSGFTFTTTMASVCTRRAPTGNMLNCQIKNLLKGPKASLEENHRLLICMAQNGLAQEAGERRATKVESPGWMPIACGIGQKGLKPHQSGVARSE